MEHIYKILKYGTFETEKKLKQKLEKEFETIFNLEKIFETIINISNIYKKYLEFPNNYKLITISMAELPIFDKLKIVVLNLDEVYLCVRHFFKGVKFKKDIEYLDFELLKPYKDYIRNSIPFLDILMELYNGNISYNEFISKYGEKTYSKLESNYLVKFTYGMNVKLDVLGKILIKITIDK